jgi:outer membrane protein, heavy metal efflux system
MAPCHRRSCVRDIRRPSSPATTPRPRCRTVPRWELFIRGLWLVLIGGVGALAFASAPLRAQLSGVPLTRASAVEAALTRGARGQVARADTTLATAMLLMARTFENPTLSAAYTRDAPRYHVAVGLPLDDVWLRGLRIHSAEAGRDAAQLRFRFERALVALDADTAYTRAIAAGARARLSARNALDADSLRRIAVARRDAGDASDLEVEMAAVNAGQQTNVAAADSLMLTSALLSLQVIIGESGDHVVIAPRDSLDPPPSVQSTATTGGIPLPVAAANRALASADIDVRIQHRSVFAATSVEAGIETGGPSSDDHTILPTFGVAFPLPLLNRNRAGVAVASAERDRARAALQLATVESGARIAQATRDVTVATARVERDRALVASANRIASLSLIAYAEGAASISTVLEAQRNARDVLGGYIDDLAALWIATSTWRVAALTTGSAQP